MLLSDDFLSVILPLPTTTLSLNVRIMFASTTTPAALSAGELEAIDGPALSAAVKLSVVVSLMPA